MHRNLLALQGHAVLELGLGDENVVESKHGSLEEDFNQWLKKFTVFIRQQGSSPSCTENAENDCSCKKKKCCSQSNEQVSQSFYIFLEVYMHI